MKFRNLIFILTIAFSAIFIGMMGTSYAYYFATGGVEFNVTTGNVDTGVSVVFAQSQYINVNTGIPINASEVDSLASKSVFTITPNVDVLTGYNAAVNVSIVDITIDEALRISDFKYKFSCSDDSTSTNLSSGDGTSFTDDVISSSTLSLGTLSTSNSTFNINKTYTCTFNVWLEETGENQNDLMNKKFRGLIKVNTVFKK